MSEALMMNALEMVVNNDGLLSIKDLGSLAQASEEINKMVDKANIWKTFVGEITKLKTDEGGDTWCGETSPLECFAEPHKAVIAKWGYKRIAALLCNPHCPRCGAYCKFANPATLLRVCESCADGTNTPSDSQLVVKSKAKEAFLLSDRDLGGLLQVTLSPGLGPGSQTSTFYSYEDIKQASFKKFGGADGLEAEIIKRTEKAMEKFNKSQSTAKPQKKKPRITKIETRPADDPCKVVSIYASKLPLGVVFFDKRMSVRTYEHSVKCRDGCAHAMKTSEMEPHVLLEHGVVFPIPFRGMRKKHKISDHLIEAPAGLSDQLKLGFPEELMVVFDGANVQRSEKASAPTEELDLMDESFVRTYGFSFLQSEFKIVLVHKWSRFFFLDCSEFSCYLYKNGRPRVLFEAHGGEISRQDSFFDVNVGEEMKNALGLESVSLVEILAAIFSKMFTVEDIEMEDLPPVEMLPITEDAIDHLQGKLNTDSSE